MHTKQGVNEMIKHRLYRGLHYVPASGKYLWVYGYLNLGFQILDPLRGCHNVETDTITQSTGLTDSEGVEIYEGDILRCASEYQISYHQVVGFTEHYPAYDLRPLLRGYSECNGLSELVSCDHWEDYEVVGNIFQNPEIVLGASNERD
jgi:hypothetical protein